MNTSQQGTIGETRVMYELAKLGLPIFREISNTSKTDIITIINGKCIKIQCKLTDCDIKGSVSIPLESRTSGEVYKKEDFDILAVYVNFLDKMVYFNWPDIEGKKNVTVRYQLNENRQKNSKLIRKIENYVDFNKTLYGVVA